MQLTRRDVLVASGTSVALAGCIGDEESPAEDDSQSGENGDDGTGGDETGDDGTGNDGTGDDETETQTPDETESDDETESMEETESDDETESASPAVRVGSHSELGDILVDAEGMTLYMFDQDTQGEGSSTCYDSCAGAWPPLTVEEEPTAGDDVEAELTTFEREDGTMQVAANGWPLYYFASDEEPGDAAGQGVNDVWWVLAPDGSPIEPDDDSDSDSDGGSY